MLATISLVCVLYILYLYLIPGYSSLMSIALFIIFSLPFFGFFIVIIFTIVYRKMLCHERLSLINKKRRHLQKDKVQENDDVKEDVCNFETNLELPDRVIHPEHYV